MNVSCQDEQLSSEASIFLSLWFSLSGLAAVTGNAVVLWLFYKNESLQTTSNRFLASLSVADLLVGLVVDPASVAIRCLTQPRESDILNKVMDMLWIHTTSATTFNVCCVSVDRFIAIRFPFRYQDILTKKTSHTIIISVWLISLFLPFTLILKDNPVNTPSTVWLSLTFITFVFPMVVVTFSYFWIFKVAKKLYESVTIPASLQNTDKTDTSRALQNYKAVKTIGLVLGVFIVSLIPCLVASIVQYFAGSDKCFYVKISFVVWPWIEAVALTSSVINPWIYYFRNDEFKLALRRYMTIL